MEFRLASGGGLIVWYSMSSHGKHGVHYVDTVSAVRWQLHDHHVCWPMFCTSVFSVSVSIRWPVKDPSLAAHRVLGAALAASDGTCRSARSC